MNIFLKELSSLKRSFFIFSFILILFLIIFMSMYPTMLESKDSLYEVFSSFSPQILEAFDVNLDTIFTPLGFYTYIFTYITIIGALMAGILGLGVMIKDNLEGATEFILTKPYPRKKILKNKLYAAICCLVATNIIYQIASIVLMFFISGSESVNVIQLILINTALLLIQLTFLTICMVIGAYIRKPSALIITSVIIIVFFYILSIIENILNNVILRYINPFSYFKASDIINNGGYNKNFIIATVFIIFFCLNFSFGSYENEDVIGK